MVEELIISEELSKEDKYKELLPQLEALVGCEKDLIANIANLVAALKYAFNFLWVGVYFVKENELVLGPFQGPIACTRIAKGKGVCGTAWQEQKVITVPNVDDFPGHIACSSATKSEIVLPVFNNNRLALVLDIDSEKLNTFDQVDEKYLAKVAKLITTLL